jgi:hypothetical protein
MKRGSAARDRSAPHLGNFKFNTELEPGVARDQFMKFEGLCFDALRRESQLTPASYDISSQNLAVLPLGRVQLVQLEPSLTDSIV